MNEINLFSFLNTLFFKTTLALIFIFSGNSAPADTFSIESQTQLAFFLGSHTANPDYYRPGHIYTVPSERPGHKNRRLRYGCEKKCTIDSWSGTVLECSTRC
ncbi:MAG: hypothetical protein PSV35_04210 [bacterium]|nr:hypothetical protein [bacterium]